MKRNLLALVAASFALVAAPSFAAAKSAPAASHAHKQQTAKVHHAKGGTQHASSAHGKKGAGKPAKSAHLA